jgi:hypothetical protein
MQSNNWKEIDMKSIQIGKTGPQASQVILGLMRIADKSDPEFARWLMPPSRPATR